MPSRTRHIILHTLLCTLLLIICSTAPAYPRASLTTDMRLMGAIRTDTLFHQGEQALLRGDTDDALKILTVVCSRDDGKSDRLMFTRAHLRRGSILYGAENYAEAMQAFLKARSIAERNGLSAPLPSIYTSIGNVFSAINDLDSGIRFYRKAMQAVGSDPESPVMQVVYNNLFYAYYLKQMPDSALKYHDLYGSLRQSDIRSRYDLLLNSALLDNLRGHREAALGKFRRAAVFARDTMHEADCAAAAISHIAEIHEKGGRLDSALFYLRSNEDMARHCSYNNLLVESLRSMARVYEAKGEDIEALRCKSAYLSLADSLFSRETINLIQNSQALYEQSADAYTITSLSYTNTQQRYWIITLVAVALLIAILSVSLWRQKRKLLAAWQVLYDRNAALLREEERRRADERRLAEIQPRPEAQSPAEEPPLTVAGDDAEASPSARRLLIDADRRSLLLGRIAEVMENPDFYCDADCSIDRLAAACESNARYVSEVINDEYGINFRAFLNRYRVKEAMRRLEDIDNYGHLTLKAIAESIGYRSQATFISVFTKETGLKPGIYQRLASERRR